MRWTAGAIHIKRRTYKSAVQVDYGERVAGGDDIVDSVHRSGEATVRITAKVSTCSTVSYRRQWER